MASSAGSMCSGGIDEVLLKIEDLRVWFPVKISAFRRGHVKAVDGVSFTLRERETLAIIGESGSGKTTLGRAILRLVKPTSGRIVYRGTDITYAKERDLKWFRREAQMIFQDPYSSLPPMMPVYRILEEPLIIHGVRSREERYKIIMKALEDVKLSPPEEFASKYPHQLSGGQRQRVAIARALVLRPRLIVADEPVSMIDVSSRAEILYLMKSLQERYNISYVYITHDIATARYFAHRVLVMYAGRPCEVGPADQVVKEPLHPYTQTLIEAVPEPDPENRKRLRNVPSGEPPNLLDPPPGCRFAPRCPLAVQRCWREDPPMIRLDSDRVVFCWIYAKK